MPESISGSTQTLDRNSLAQLLGVSTRTLDRCGTVVPSLVPLRPLADVLSVHGLSWKDGCSERDFGLGSCALQLPKAAM